LLFTITFDHKYYLITW